MEKMMVDHDEFKCDDSEYAIETHKLSKRAR
jgi:hypothetical protein